MVIKNVTEIASPNIWTCRTASIPVKMRKFEVTSHNNIRQPSQRVFCQKLLEIDKKRLICIRWSIESWKEKIEACHNHGKSNLHHWMLELRRYHWTRQYIGSESEVTDITKYSSLVTFHKFVTYFTRVLEFSSRGASFSRAQTSENINVLVAWVRFNVPTA